MAPKQRALLLVILSTAALPLLLAGCQSNAQQDLVARELRTQEDQLYAMEHYLEQYQQLVCKYRSENAALRRRMEDDYYDETDELPKLRPAPRTPAGVRPAPGGPMDAPMSPPPEDLEPDVPAIELPEVPPLEGATQDESDGPEIVTASYEELARDEEPAAETAAQVATGLSDLYEVEAAIAATEAERPGDSPVDAPSGAEASPVWLHGEVVENDAGGGPRLAVNVDHFDELGNHSSFEGTLSLMLMATSEGGRQKSLARWDYSAEDVNDAAIDVAFEPTMRFHLELPAETPLDESTELWVRLVPAEGPKLLTHTTIDLQQPGSFSSRSDWPAVDGEANDSAMIASNEAASPVDEPEDAVESASEEAPSLGSRIAVNIVGSDWTTARPNEPANLPAEPEPGVGWRASSEIIATVVQSKPAPPPKKPHYDVQPAVHTETAAAPPTLPAYKPPTWSPDRAQPTNDPVRKSRDVARRPAWSATR